MFARLLCLSLGGAVHINTWQMQDHGAHCGNNEYAGRLQRSTLRGIDAMTRALSPNFDVGGESAARFVQTPKWWPSERL